MPEEPATMNAEELRQRQAPLKHQYTAHPEDAIAVLSATGTVNFQNQTCEIDCPNALNGKTTSGLHPKAGGTGAEACSGDMLLQSLIACAGVTLSAVATAMNMKIDSARIVAQGTMDFRGTLGIDRSVPVGLTSVKLQFTLKSHESADQIAKLIQLTERYCVILQTIKSNLSVTTASSLIPPTE